MINKNNLNCDLSSEIKSRQEGAKVKKSDISFINLRYGFVFNRFDENSLFLQSYLKFRNNVLTQKV